MYICIYIYIYFSLQVEEKLVEIKRNPPPQKKRFVSQICLCSILNYCVCSTFIKNFILKVRNRAHRKVNIRCSCSKKLLRISSQQTWLQSIKPSVGTSDYGALCNLRGRTPGMFALTKTVGLVKLFSRFLSWCVRLYINSHINACWQRPCPSITLELTKTFSISTRNFHISPLHWDMGKNSARFYWNLLQTYTTVEGRRPPLDKSLAWGGKLSDLQSKVPTTQGTDVREVDLLFRYLKTGSPQRAPIQHWGNQSWMTSVLAHKSDLEYLSAPQSLSSTPSHPTQPNTRRCLYVFGTRNGPALNTHFPPFYSSEIHVT